MVQLITHPFVHDALATLRDASTPPDIFRRVAKRMTLLVAADVLKDVDTVDGTVQTPLGPAFARRVNAQVTLVPILRAGLGMIEGVLDLLPSARVGHIGLQRDEATAMAERYYVKLPPRIDDDVVLITDPMLATGGSAVAAIEIVRAAGARDVRFVCMVAAPGRHRRDRTALSGSPHLHAGRGPRTERPQVHRPGPGRLRRSPVRHGVTGSPGPRSADRQIEINTSPDRQIRSPDRQINRSRDASVISCPPRPLTVD